MRARDNPFASNRVLAVRYRPQGCTWEDLLARLQSLRYRAAIVGPCGTGKTTLLEDLAPRLRGFEPVFLRLDATERRLSPQQWARIDAAGPRQILLLDGAEQLPPIHWICFKHRARRAGGLVITTHRPGRLPTLLNTTTSAALLKELLEELGASCPAPNLLLHRHAGNIREAIRELYDTCSAG